MVCIGHLAHARIVPNFFGDYAYTGVKIFFVISGYLITTLLLAEHAETATIDLRQFYIRRAYRILPAAAVFMAFALLFYWRDLRWYDIAAMIFYLVNFDPLRPGIISHLWSLAVEEQFYFLWPSVLRKWYRHRIAILVAVMAVAPFYSAVCYRLHFMKSGFGTFPAVADNLAIGCLLAILGPRIPRIPGWTACLFLAAVALLPHFFANTGIRTLLQLFVFNPLLYCSIAGLVLHVIRTPYRFLNNAPIMWLGRISYSLYLWQEPFFYSEHSSLSRLILCLSLACLSYYVVEQPMLRLRSRKTAPLGIPILEKTVA
jgi:peptidoglycan/LPS O-acetylase OafA/YrhL